MAAKIIVSLQEITSEWPDNQRFSGHSEIPCSSNEDADAVAKEVWEAVDAVKRRRQI